MVCPGDQWFYKLLILLMVPQSIWAANVACQEVRYKYSAQGMNVYDVPLKMQSGEKIFFNDSYLGNLLSKHSIFV